MSSQVNEDEELAVTSNRRDRRKRETRDRIMKAARSLFAEQGYDGTKLTDICEKADIAHQTFFNHFPGKRDLMSELARVGIDNLVASVEAAQCKGDSTRERLQLFYEGFTRAALALGPKSREFMAVGIRATQEIHDEAQSRRVHDAFGALVQQGLDEGDVTRRYELSTLVELVVGTHYVLMSDWTLQPDLDVEKRARQISALLGDAIEKRPDESD